MHERATLTFSRQLQSRVALTDMLALARGAGRATAARRSHDAARCASSWRRR